MPKLNVDFNSVSGKIRPLHSVGQPPWLGVDGKYLHYLTDANIPYSRLHDMGGAYGGSIYVDIPNIFRDFDADPENPDSYDFAFTDNLITKMYENKIEPIYRLGVTIENYIHIKRYFTFPPKDYQKWAKICEMIIRHYNEGWADGFTYGIKYWEIWNEPDFHIYSLKDNMMWYGSPEQFYELYDVSSKHLKNCFGDSIKVGGYGACGFYRILSDPEKYGVHGKKNDNPGLLSEQKKGHMDFFHGFFEYIKKSGAPLDFFSWHSYASVEDTVIKAEYCEKMLDEYGYGNAEIQLNEWNNAHHLEERGTSFASAQTAAMMIALHKTSRMNIMCYYDARLGPSVYGGLFNPLNHKPLCTYYSFAAFGELYVLGNCVKSECDGVYTLAATDGNGKNAVMIANTADDAVIEAALGETFKAYLVDENNFLAEAPFDGKKINLNKNQVMLIKNY